MEFNHNITRDLISERIFLLVTTDMTPIITKCSSYLAFIERTGERREMYRFATDSSKPNSIEIDTLWINQKRYNFFNVRFSAMFIPPENMMHPNYVQEFKLGIVSGQIQVDLTKVDRNGTVLMSFYFNEMNHFIVSI